MDDTDSEQRYIPHSGAMFSRGGTARAEMATDLAIPILAEGGWAALTLRNVARAANVTPQAIAAWFPSVAAMRVAVAARYGDRWIRQRGHQAHLRVLRTHSGSGTPVLADLAVTLLPQSWLEEVFDGIWLTVVEAGRWDEAVGSAVAAVQQRERDLVRELLDPSASGEREHLERDVDLVLALVRGLRVTHVPLREGSTGLRAGTVVAGLEHRA